MPCKMFHVEHFAGVLLSLAPSVRGLRPQAVGERDQFLSKTLGYCKLLSLRRSAPPPFQKEAL